MRAVRLRVKVALLVALFVMLLPGCAGVLTGDSADAKKPEVIAAAPASLPALPDGTKWSLRMTFAAAAAPDANEGVAKEARRGLFAGIIALAQGTSRWIVGGYGAAAEASDSLSKGAATVVGSDSVFGAINNAVASGRVLTIELIGVEDVDKAKP